MRNLSCPNCDERKLERYRSPIKKGRVLYRRHRCKNCRKVSITAQLVVSRAVAEKLLDEFED